MNLHKPARFFRELQRAPHLFAIEFYLVRIVPDVISEVQAGKIVDAESATP